MDSEQHNYKNYRFPGQRSNEHIRLLIRKHWIIDLKITLGLFILGGLPLFAALGLELFVWTELNDTVLTILLFFDLYLMTILAVTYTNWLNDELDVVIVTETRIIFHEQIDMFHRKVTESPLAQIQDVTGTQKGITESLLHYGSIIVKTSSADVFFVIPHVKDPYEHARRFLDLRDQALKITPNA